MRTERLRIGIIGPGRIAHLHMDAIRRNPQVHLVAVAASTPEKAQRVAANWDIPLAFGDYRQLLASNEVDVVHIATRNQSHYTIAREALLAGKHVVCEKPLGTDSQQTAELLDIARQTGLVHALCYVLRFYPLVHHMRAMVQQGQLGDLHTVYGSYLQDWLSADTSYDWRCDAAESGPTRTVADIGTHWLDMLQFVTGMEVSAVMADLSTVFATRQPAAKVQGDRSQAVPVNTEDKAALLLDLQGKVKGTCLVSQVAVGHKNELHLEIHGTRASLSWDSERPNELWIGHQSRANECLWGEEGLLAPEARAVCGPGKMKGGQHTWQQFTTAVYSAIRSGGPFDPSAVTFATFAEGHRDQRILEAVVASHRKRQWVDIRQPG